MVGKRAPLSERLWAKIAIGASDECWLWTGSLDTGGYPQIWSGPKGVMRLAHRAVYELSVGPIDDGLDVCHTCDVPRCCNPAHLFLGTATDNAVDMCMKGRNVILRGERNPNAKLTDAQIAEIRSSTDKQALIAARFGIRQGSVSNIVRGKSRQSLSA